MFLVPWVIEKVRVLEEVLRASPQFCAFWLIFALVFAELSRRVHPLLPVFILPVYVLVSGIVATWVLKHLLLEPGEDEADR